MSNYLSFAHWDMQRYGYPALFILLEPKCIIYYLHRSIPCR